MLKNDKIIHRMSLRQKLQLVFSKTIFTNSEVSDYNFPVLRLLKEHKKRSDTQKATQFPSEYSLSLSWNEDLIKSLTRAFYEENRVFADDKSFLFDMSEGVNSFSDDSFLTYKIISSMIQGIDSVDGYSFLFSSLKTGDEVLKKELSFLPYELTADNTEVKNVILSSLEELSFYQNEKKFKGRIFACAGTLKDIIRFLNKGVMFIYYKGEEDLYESVLDNLEVAVKKYDYVTRQFENHIIDENVILRMEKDAEILSIDKIDTACDKMVDLYLEYDSYVKEENVKTYSEEEHAALALEGAKESIVMLKNEENILPLGLKTTVGLIGDSFINKEYYGEIYEQTPTEFITPFDEVQKYTEIKYLGFAHGYLKGKESSSSLIEKAKELASLVNVTVCYLWNENNGHTLPKAQLDLVSALASVNHNLVLVIHSAVNIDLSFIDQAASVLLVNNVGQGEVRAVLDMLCGKVSPSGHLVHPYPLNPSDKHQENGLPDYLDKTIAVRYPFGYGLSYGIFEYSFLEVSEVGVKFTIRNISDYDAYSFTQLYVCKENTSSSLSSFLLKGFRKFYIPKGECMKVTIPFDSYTFRYFNTKKKCYGIEGGEYIIHINTDSDTCVLEGKIRLSRFIDEKFGFRNELTERAFDSEEYVDTFLNSASKEKERGLTYRQKLIADIGLFVYFTLFFAVLLIINQGESMEASIVFSVLLAVTDIPLAVWFILLMRRRPEKEEGVQANENLSAMLKDVKEAEVLSTERFEKEENVSEDENAFYSPVAEEMNIPETEETLEEAVQDIAEEEKPAEVNENTELSPEEIKTMEEEELRLMEEQMASRGQKVKEDEEEEVITYDNESSLSQVCFNFIDLAKSKGIYIDLSSVRSLFSSFASSRILFLNTKIKELMPPFLECLNEFLGDKVLPYKCESTWISSFNLQWVKDEYGNYVNSPFVEAIIRANKLKDNLNIAILNNVDMKNFDSYFRDYIAYANAPKTQTKINISRTNILSLPENLIFIIIPQDDYFMNDLKKEVAASSGYVELLMRKDAEVPLMEGTEVDALSRSYFEELIHEARKKSFISEENWKKIDSFINGINSYVPFVLSNKNVLSFERYAALYIGTGGDEADALDSLIAEKILPLIKALQFIHSQDDEDKVIELIRTSFGEENTKRAVRAFSSFRKNS